MTVSVKKIRFEKVVIAGMFEQSRTAQFVYYPTRIIVTKIRMIFTLLLLSGLASTHGMPDQPSVLILSGQNNHDWKRTVAHLEHILLDTDLFSVNVTLTPGKDADSNTWSDWNPKFDAYDVVLLAYNGELWPERVRRNFEEYVSSGGSVLVQHAANNPFSGWDAYESMVGLYWT